MKSEHFVQFYRDSFEQLSDPVKLDYGKKFDLCATVVRSKSKGRTMLDVRLWNNGVPTSTGIYFTMPTARNLRDQLNKYLGEDDHQDVVEQLGYDPFED